MNHLFPCWRPAQPPALSPTVQVDVSPVLGDASDGESVSESQADDLARTANLLTDPALAEAEEQADRDALRRSLSAIEALLEVYPTTDVNDLARLHVEAVLREPEFTADDLSVFLSLLDRSVDNLASRGDDCHALAERATAWLQAVMDAGDTHERARSLVILSRAAVANGGLDRSRDAAKQWMRQATKQAKRGQQNELNATLGAILRCHGRRRGTGLMNWVRRQLATCALANGADSPELELLCTVLQKTSMKSVLSELYLPQDADVDEPPPEEPDPALACGPAAAAQTPWGARIPLKFRLALAMLQEGGPHWVGRFVGGMATTRLVEALYGEAGAVTPALVLYGATSLLSILNEFYFDGYLRGSMDFEPPQVETRVPVRLPPTLRSVRWIKTFTLCSTLLLPPVFFSMGCAVHAATGGLGVGGGVNATTEANGTDCEFSLPAASRDDMMDYAARWALAAESIFFSGDVARCARELLQRLLQSPLTSPVTLVYCLPNGEVHKLTDNDIARLYVLRDAGYVAASVGLNFGLRYALPDLHDRVDRKFCYLRNTFGGDLASPLGGGLTEALDAAIPAWAMLLVARFPEAFGLDPQLAPFVVARYSEQKGPFQDMVSTLRDMEVGVSTRWWAQRTASDVPAALAWMFKELDLESLEMLMVFVGAFLNGLVGSRRGNWGAYSKDPHGVPIPRGLMSILARPSRNWERGAQTLRVAKLMEAVAAQRGRRRQLLDPEPV